ncbi:MAG TPA: dipeptide ABC transporter ATP-binding protein [Dongiaceae bacterium]|jgi:peptide/nickel transport system ATP-binding protein|nr:dipeptide ABC transporter ATP-binding protein [Dongiaceae bacterium]
MNAVLPQAATGTPLLKARNVSKQFKVGNSVIPGENKVVHAVDSVSLDVWRGETLGLVGESGCGKSTLGRCLVRLYEITEGTIQFEGHDISTLGRNALRPIRRRMQMVFQDPYSSLNPRRRVADLLAEPLKVHGRRSRSEIGDRVAELMRLVELQPDHLARFPHEFSGGQRQRIGIARALALEPSLVVADEPVSALDVSIQAQIVNLFADLQERLGLTYVFIAHDLSVVRQVSTRTAVMYLGSIVESGPTEDIFQTPRHPYSEALISAVPVADLDQARSRQRIVLQGDVPSPINPPSGCRFHPRCRYATERCKVERPKLAPLDDGRLVACHHPVGL